MPRAVAKTQLVSSQTPIVDPAIWLLMVGVNEYDDPALQSLQYSAIDCKTLADTLSSVTQIFSGQHFFLHHNLGALAPTRENLLVALQTITANAQPQDTVLVYFSGHGMLDPKTQQAVLCLRDTDTERAIETGLPVGMLLRSLDASQAERQIIWLDACHSGGMSLRGLNPAEQLVELLQQQAAKRQGLYALLSCDRSQQSWEFPELGHGVFTHFLIEGLRQGVVSESGWIDADGLYRYVYHETLRYVDQTNQQLRLVNQQKRSRGETLLTPEYPLQTPKRIVEGVGEFRIGKRVLDLSRNTDQPRQAVVFDALNRQSTRDFAQVLSQSGQFQVDYYPKAGQTGEELATAVREAIATGLQSKTTTALIYLCDPESLTIDRLALQSVVRSTTVAHQVLLLEQEESIDGLKLESAGQCILASARSDFATVLKDELLGSIAKLDAGLSAAEWISRLRIAMAGSAMQVWLSGCQGVIEMVPRQAIGKAQHADLNLCPYMGLEAFGESDAPYFYGRDGLLQILIQRIEQSIREPNFYHNAIVLVGSSGSGKSSLVQAGLIAQLRRGDRMVGSGEWWIGRVRPGDRPFQALSICLAGVCLAGQTDQAPEPVEGLLHQGVEGLVYWLRSRPEPICLLVIDQFEELFTLTSESERAQFLALIFGAIEFAGDRFKVVMTVRADFVGKCLEVPKLAEVVQRSSLLVPACLEESDYRTVMVEPAKKVGLKIEPELVERLLQELDRTTGDLPLLQFVLQQLWQVRTDGTLTLKSYQSEIGGLRGVLEKKAQDVYDRLSPEGQDCARWIFLNLTQLGEESADTRRRVAIDQLAIHRYPQALVNQTLNALVNAKLITVSNGGEGLVKSNKPSNALANGPPTPNSGGAELKNEELATSTVEVAHEILIRHWSTLRWWLDENRDRLQAQRQIEQAGLQWKEHEQKPEFLLRGVRLAKGEDLLIGYADELTDLTTAFISASIDERQRELRETKRRLRQARGAIALISSLGIGALGLAGAAAWNSRQAALKEVAALTNSSESFLTSHQQLESLITALEASDRLAQVQRSSGWLIPVPDAEQLTVTATLQQAIDLTLEKTREKLTRPTIDQTTQNLIAQIKAKRLFKSRSGINSAVKLKDGKTIVLGNESGMIYVMKDGTVIRSWKAMGDRVSEIAISPDEKTILSAGLDKNAQTSLKDGLIKQWDLSGTLVRVYEGHRDQVNSVSWHPDGQRFVSGGADGMVIVWALDGSIVGQMEGHKGSVTRVRVNPQGDRVVTEGQDDQTKRSWEMPPILPRGDVSVTPLDAIVSAKVEQGNVRAIAGWDQSLTVETRDGKRVGLSGQRSAITQLVFLDSPQFLLSGGKDGEILLWDVQGRSVLKRLKGYESEISGLRFENGRLTVEAENAGTRVWDWDLHRLRQRGCDRVREYLQMQGNVKGICK